MKLGTETGSLINHVLAHPAQCTPVVGGGATICLWSDRHAATIVKVTPSQVHVQQDKATRTDKNGMSECQEYAYEADTSAPVRIFRKTKRGYREAGGGSYLSIGVRREYYDFSF